MSTSTSINHINLSSELKQEARALGQIVYESRRCRKKVNGQPIWTVELDIAFVEGMMIFALELEVRNMATAERYPKRSQLISDYISWKVPSTPRDSKQVSSRMQQLQTNENVMEAQHFQRLVRWLYPQRYTSNYAASSPADSTLANSPSSRYDTLSPSPPPCQFIAINQVEELWINIHTLNVHLCTTFLSLPTPCNTVAVTCTSEIVDAHTLASRPLFLEETEYDTLRALASPWPVPGCQTHRYETSLLPRSWRALVRMSPYDLVQHAIKQTIYDNQNRTTLFEAIHRFYAPSV